MEQKRLGNLSLGKLFIISGPAGSGKTTLAHLIINEFDSVICSVSCTTRSPRPGEIDGKDYYFLSKEEFEKKSRDNEFLESALVFGHLYGTLKKQVEEKRLLGYHVLLVIDVQGGLALQTLGIQATYIFITPPCLDTLEQRLVARKSETETERKDRLMRAQEEIQAKSSYDYLIVNRDLNIAHDVLRSILIAEEHRI